MQESRVQEVDRLVCACDELAQDLSAATVVKAALQYVITAGRTCLIPGSTNTLGENLSTGGSKMR